MRYTDWHKKVETILDGYVDPTIEDKLFELYKDNYSPIDAVEVVDREYAAEEYDGQPDEAKEWEDFGEVYDDDYPLFDGGEY
jgi:hypothetical protein